MPPPPRDTFPNAFEAAFLVACLFAVEFLIGTAFYDAKDVLGMDPNELMSVVLVLANGLLLTAVMHWSGLSYASLFQPAKSSPWAVMGLLALPILSLLPALTLGIDALEDVVVALFPLSAADAALFERMDSGSLISLLTASLIAPAVEEMLFRGIILRSFLGQYRRWPSIFGSALLFGLSHLNVYQAVAAFIGGVVMGWLYERTRSLWPGLLLHAGYNVALRVEVGPDSAIWPARWLLAILLAIAGTAMLRRLLLPRRR